MRLCRWRHSTHRHDKKHRNNEQQTHNEICLLSRKKNHVVRCRGVQGARRVELRRGPLITDGSELKLRLGKEDACGTSLGAEPTLQVAEISQHPRSSRRIIATMMVMRVTHTSTCTSQPRCMLRPLRCWLLLWSLVFALKTPLERGEDPLSNLPSTPKCQMHLFCACFQSVWSTKKTKRCSHQNEFFFNPRH